MQTQVKTWGNSQGIRISKETMQEAGLSIDDVLDVKVVNGIIMLEKQ
ncbi:MAG: AbrB/MazE/SpoVT family DNA-binding domain-containing protein [Lachnospiraceae bacterium]|nr:AbrB/MazE/SpoVT family DNA-binding domain-containing protein [Lachnospiraceae bacterium]